MHRASLLLVGGSALGEGSLGMCGLELLFPGLSCHCRLPSPYLDPLDQSIIRLDPVPSGENRGSCLRESLASGIQSTVPGQSHPRKVTVPSSNHSGSGSHYQGLQDQNAPPALAVTLLTSDGSVSGGYSKPLSLPTLPSGI